MARWGKSLHFAPILRSNRARNVQEILSPTHSWGELHFLLKEDEGAQGSSCIRVYVCPSKNGPIREINQIWSHSRPLHLLHTPAFCRSQRILNKALPCSVSAPTPLSLIKPTYSSFPSLSSLALALRSKFFLYNLDVTLPPQPRTSESPAQSFSCVVPIVSMQSPVSPLCTSSAIPLFLNTPLNSFSIHGSVVIFTDARSSFPNPTSTQTSFPHRSAFHTLFIPHL